MSGRPELKLDWCSHAAAKAACERWHYSGSLPPPPHIRVGVWECGRFIGCVLFARGASAELLAPYGLTNTQGCELVRVALGKHATPVTRIVAVALRLLRRQNPGLRLVVSFADPAHGHHGGIYQGGGWIYAGTTAPSAMYRDADGKLWHTRMISTTGVRRVFGKQRRVLKPTDCERIEMPGKHRYLLPLDDEIRDRIAALAKPYPKRPKHSNDAPAAQAGEGGAEPTRTLQSSATDPADRTT